MVNALFCISPTSLLLPPPSAPPPCQILIREYHFDAKHKPVFTEEDVLNIFPIVKHISHRASDGLYLLHCGSAMVQHGEHGRH